MPSVRHIRLAYNNVYVLEGVPSPVLIDSGPDYEGAAEAILAALGGQNPAVAVATHGHLDHAGLGAWWQARGVPVALGAEDEHLASAPQLADTAEFEAFADYVCSIGTPPDTQAEVIAGLERRRSWAADAATTSTYRPGGDGRWPTQLRYHHFPPAQRLYDGQVIEGSSLRVIDCPGHTPGNLVLFDDQEGWLFSGDQLLPEITPTPAIQIAPASAGHASWRFPSLPRFLDSMHRIRGLGATYCWPGHGDPFANVTAVIDENIAQVEQRTERVLAVLRQHGRSTTYALAEDIYPRALRRRYWQIIATMQGHLDLLVERSQVAIEDNSYSVKP